MALHTGKSNRTDTGTSKQDVITESAADEDISVLVLVADSSINSSGYKGVNWNKNRCKYEAWFNSRTKYLGAFKTAKEAAAVIIKFGHSKAAYRTSTNTSEQDRCTNFC